MPFKTAETTISENHEFFYITALQNDPLFSELIESSIVRSLGCFHQKFPRYCFMDVHSSEIP